MKIQALFLQLTRPAGRSIRSLNREGRPPHSHQKNASPQEDILITGLRPLVPISTPLELGPTPT